MATDRYGPAAAPRVRRAWALFGEAFREYPYDGSVVYNCPVQLGPANLLYARPTGYAATMVGIPYDEVAQIALLPVAHTLGTEFRPAQRRPMDDVVHWDRW